MTTSPRPDPAQLAANRICNLFGIPYPSDNKDCAAIIRAAYSEAYPVDADTSEIDDAMEYLAGCVVVNKDAYADTTSKAEAADKLAEALEPFTHPDLSERLAGNNLGDESTLWERDNAVLKLGDFRKARELYIAYRASTQPAESDLSDDNIVFGFLSQIQGLSGSAIKFDNDGHARIQYKGYTIRVSATKSAPTTGPKDEEVLGRGGV